MSLPVTHIMEKAARSRLLNLTQEGCRQKLADCADSSISESFEVWNNGIKENTAHAAHRHRSCLALACNTFLWVVVHAAIVALVMPLEPNTATLSPVLAPTVLNDPVLVAVLFTIAHRSHCVIDHSVLTAAIENAIVIAEPCVGCNRHCHWTLLGD